ncbi:MAG: DUF1127 domain-containing protein [Acetobacteraceae bacterium]|nr:DUF1127 domain-containing protein [Acetobacteraceae bacterium]
MRMPSGQSRRAAAVSLEELLHPDTDPPTAASGVARPGLRLEEWGTPRKWPGRRGTPSRLLRGLAARAAAWRERRAVVGALSAMSDRELADIGLGRAQIHDVFGPGFAREHARPGCPWEPALAPNTLALAPHTLAPNTMKQESTMKTILAALLVAFMALTGITATAHAYDAAPDRTTVSGNEAG